MNIIIMWLYRLVGKPIKLEIMDNVGKFHIYEMNIENKFDGNQIVTIKLLRSELDEMSYCDFIEALHK